MVHSHRHRPSDFQAHDKAIKTSGIANALMPGINPWSGFEEARVEDLLFWSHVIPEGLGAQHSELSVCTQYSKASRLGDNLAVVPVASNTVQQPWSIGRGDNTLTLVQLRLLESLALNLEGEFGGIGTKLVRTALSIKDFHPTFLPRDTAYTIDSLTFSKVTLKHEPGSRVSDKVTLPRETIQRSAGYFSLFTG